jgi:hypothetical protein
MSPIDNAQEAFCINQLAIKLYCKRQFLNHDNSCVKSGEIK